MHFEEKTISKESIYKGKIIEVEKHKVSLPNNETAYREVVKHNGAVAICALTPDQQVILVKQYRKALEQELLEILRANLNLEKTANLQRCESLKKKQDIKQRNSL